MMPITEPKSEEQKPGQYRRPPAPETRAWSRSFSAHTVEQLYRRFGRPSSDIGTIVYAAMVNQPHRAFPHWSEIHSYRKQDVKQ
jgi:hypothetical protein